MTAAHGTAWTNGASRFAQRATWLIFAKTAGDRQRFAYSTVLALMHRRQIALRKAAALTLPVPQIRIDPQVGFARTTLADLGFSNTVVSEALNLAVSLNDTTSISGKPYLQSFPIRGLNRSSALLQFALDHRVLAIVSSYLGMLPCLTDILILRSPAGTTPYGGSQLFHCDYEDKRQVKIFIHCSDVGIANGPLHALPAALSRRVKDSVNYRYGGRAFRLQDRVVHTFAGTNEVQSFIGPPGTITLIDTGSCLHYGSRMLSLDRSRLIVQFQYLTPAAFELAILPRLRHPDVAARVQEAPLETLVLATRIPHPTANGKRSA